MLKPQNIVFQERIAEPAVIATSLRDCAANYRGGQEASPKRFARISPTQISVLDQWLRIRYDGIAC